MKEAFAGEGPLVFMSSPEAIPGGEKTLAAAFAQPALQTAVKWHAKYARQNGIHVSPTFMVDGLVQADLGSGDPVETWLARLLG
jgi:protein-disulfide isomerase